jgi:hypothetical protein
MNMDFTANFNVRTNIRHSFGVFFLFSSNIFEHKIGGFSFIDSAASEWARELTSRKD